MELPDAAGIAVCVPFSEHDTKADTSFCTGLHHVHHPRNRAPTVGRDRFCQKKNQGVFRFFWSCSWSTLCEEDLGAGPGNSVSLWRNKAPSACALCVRAVAVPSAQLVGVTTRRESLLVNERAAFFALCSGSLLALLIYLGVHTAAVCAVVILCARIVLSPAVHATACRSSTLDCSEM